MISEYQPLILGMTALGFSLAVSLLIVGSQKWHGALSHDHDLDGVQKVHTTAVPRIGGLAIVLGFLLGFLLFRERLALSVDTHGHILALLVASLPAFLAGLIEDVTKRVSVRMRLAATALSALIASFMLDATLNEVNIWGVDLLLTMAPVAIFATAVFVAGGANAINIIDGFNGLSGSTIVIMASGLAAVAAQNGDMLVVNLGVLCIGATLGFLMVNYPRGRLFLGDGGAYFLGFWVSEMAVLVLVRNEQVNSWQVLAICAYPVIEVLFSIYRRKVIQNVSPGAPDALHLHTLVYRRLVFKHVHRDAARPWQRNAAVVLFIAPAVAGCVAVAALAGQPAFVSVAIVIAQVALYVAVYGRLVRGHWGVARSSKPGVDVDVDANMQVR